MKQNTLHSIQTLRGIAALLIVVFHSYVHLEARDIIPDIPTLVSSTRTGVDIFFVISGFIMVFISGDSFGKPGAPQKFFIRRIIRIVPIYWLYTLCMAALLLLVPQYFSHGKSFSTSHLAASLTFIPWPNNIGQIKPVLQVGWTLNFEMYFYLVFTFLLFLSKKVFLPLLTTIMVGGFIAGLVMPTQNSIYYVITSPLLIEFLLGCMIGLYCQRQETLGVSAGSSIFMVIAGAVLLLLTGIVDTTQVPRIVKWGIPSALLVAGAIFLERNGKIYHHSLLAKLGDSSYSLYLTHIFSINAVGKVWAMVFGSRYDIFIGVAITVSIVIGYIGYLVVEKPTTTYLNIWYETRRLRITEAPAQ
jgi:exopolysaccharide production protein ExoZ